MGRSIGCRWPDHRGPDARWGAGAVIAGFVVLAVLLLAGCSGTEEGSAGPPRLVPTSLAVPASTPAPAPPDESPQAFTSGAEQTPVPVAAVPAQRQDGNRSVGGMGRVPDVDPVDVLLAGVPVCVVGLSIADGPAWAVALEIGTVEVVTIGPDGSATIAPLGVLPPGTPPAVWVEDGSVALVPRPGDASPLSHPSIAADGSVLAVQTDGTVAIDSGGERVRVAVGALPDARIVLGDGRALVLFGPTEDYRHGVLGDVVEASFISVIDVGTGSMIAIIDVPDGLVVEGLAPIWTDLDGDGRREAIVTLSNAVQGAQLAVFGGPGAPAALGPAIGRGSRWRHQIAVAPFGSSGEVEVVAVRTPHIGGIVEFYRPAGDRLDIVASVDGFTSHVIGSRNRGHLLRTVVAPPPPPQPVTLTVAVIDGWMEQK